MVIHNVFEPGRDLVYGLVPRNPFKPIPRTFQRIFEAVGMVLVISNIESLAADIPLAVQVVLVAPAFDDLIIFDANFQSAEIDSQNTRCFFPLGHICLLK